MVTNQVIELNHNWIDLNYWDDGWAIWQADWGLLIKV
jgi:hypothetical protein